ncbi:MAG TPA: ABC transporter ATP-binding protein [Mesotoga sp.]|nr:MULTISPECIES: ABC transporter ATP-binding protein [Mesotoga]HNQ70304.1 ABC transporter ATP-binding protein [Mesotoga prima]HNS75214.1 ABC transporter ATP-binding protein [Mesotoga prima]HOZ99947.1 ABC transporter ATP-binding protein [Mesotoga prima]HPE54194.1 ABC transporter ATP-binding protein [Mesotoga prima]HQN61373.1 ABC transporter ATP-binding protein [Mesotoga prima]
MNRQESEQLLQCRNLVAGYRIKSGFVHAVDDVSFDLERGGFLGIAGESGCGKSTLAFAIMRLLKDNATIENGSLFFNGTDLVGLREEEMKKIRWVDISMAFQSAMNALNPVLSIGEQLTDVIHAHGEVRQSEARDRAIEALKLVDIPRDRFNSYPHQLSGGMKQRVMIAMALILNPDLIIMDEPTTALDVVVQRTIIEKIQELRKSLGFSVIFITHDLSLLVEISDTLAIMYAGKIVEYGNSDELFNMPLHPYTIGLMNSFPSLTGKITRMGGIEGKPPDLLNPPEGCRFHPRCPHAMDICEKSCPALQKVDPRHSVACFLHKGAENL